MENDLDFVSDNLLSTNDTEVLAKKRENFKKEIEGCLRHGFELTNTQIEKFSEIIVRRTFDAGVVN